MAPPSETEGGSFAPQEEAFLKRPDALVDREAARAKLTQYLNSQSLVTDLLTKDNDFVEAFGMADQLHSRQIRYSDQSVFIRHPLRATMKYLLSRESYPMERRKLKPSWERAGLRNRYPDWKKTIIGEVAHDTVEDSPKLIDGLREELAEVRDASPQRFYSTVPPFYLAYHFHMLGWLEKRGVAIVGSPDEQFRALLHAKETPAEFQRFVAAVFARRFGFRVARQLYLMTRPALPEGISKDEGFWYYASGFSDPRIPAQDRLDAAEGKLCDNTDNMETLDLVNKLEKGISAFERSCEMFVHLAAAGPSLRLLEDNYRSQSDAFYDIVSVFSPSGNTAKVDQLARHYVGHVHSLKRHLDDPVFLNGKIDELRAKMGPEGPVRPRRYGFTPARSPRGAFTL